MPRLLEKQIQKLGEDLLQLDGWRVLRLEQNYSERKRKSVGEPGAADGLYLRYLEEGHGQILWIEWKKPGGVVSRQQRWWIEQERQRGGLVWLAGETFPPDVDSFLEFYRQSGFNHRL